MPPVNKTNCRADKMSIKEATLEEVRNEHGVVEERIVKKIDHYTVTCPECEGVGRYDKLSEVVCEDCGMVLSGDRKPVLPTVAPRTSEATEEKGDAPVGPQDPMI